MQQTEHVGSRPAEPVQGGDPAFLARREIGRDALLLLLLAALCAGLAVAAISFLLLSREARSELVDIAGHNSRLLDGKLRRALELSVLGHASESPAGERFRHRLQGPKDAGDAFELRAFVLAPGMANQVERMLPVVLTRAMLVRGLGRELPHLGKLDLWILTREPAAAWNLVAVEGVDSNGADSGAFLAGCDSGQAAGVLSIQGRLVACVYVPAADAYLLTTANQLDFYHAALRWSLELFLITSLCFFCGVVVTYKGQRRYLTSLFTATDALRQDVSRRRESIKHLQREVREHSVARRIAEFGRWVTRLSDGNFYWHEVDDEVARIYGMDRNVLVGSLADSPGNLHPDDRDRIAVHWAYINVKLFPYMLRYRLVQPGGTVREIIEIGEPWFGIRGEVLGFHGIVQDVTGRRMETTEGIIRPPFPLTSPPPA